MVIERDCLLTNVLIRSSDIIIFDDREIHIPEYVFKWMMSLSDQSPEVVRLISSPVLPKWLQPIMFAEQHGSVSTNPLDDRLKVTFDGI